jgi:M6 family metalloprotease-like protein
VKPRIEGRSPEMKGRGMREMRGMMRMAAVAAALAAAPAAGQDVELRPGMRVHSLPPGYREHAGQAPAFPRPGRGWLGGRAALPGTPAAAAPRRSPRMVVMPALFADSPEPAVSAASIQRTLFGDNPDGNLTQYYEEISLGAMRITGTVTPWVRSAYTRAQVLGQAYGMGNDALLGWYLKDVLDRVDETTDFALYDSDGPDGVPNSGDDDGVVDMAAFQFTEVAAPCGGPGMWPHRYRMDALRGAPYFTDDPGAGGRRIRVDDYHIQSAVECDGTPQSMAVMAHETGHKFAMPDWYHAAGGDHPADHRWIQGCWTLMGAGAWGCGDGSTFGKVARPPHPGPLEKLALQWTVPTVAQPGWRRTYTLRPVQQSGDVLHVPMAVPWEFLLLEYRVNTGFDAGLPAAGVLVYHVDTMRTGLPCLTCPRLYLASLVEADGDGALLRTAREGGDRGVAGDAFTGRRLLDDRSRPVLRLNTGQPAGVALEIDVSGGVARVTVSTVPAVASAPLLAPLLGSPGGPLTDDERAALDYFGNRDGRYDAGDLRTYMRYRRDTVRQEEAAAAGLPPASGAG